jgi:hypothetical protein
VVLELLGLCRQPISFRGWICYFTLCSGIQTEPKELAVKSEVLGFHFLRNAMPLDFQSFGVGVSIGK